MNDETALGTIGMQQPGREDIAMLTDEDLPIVGEARKLDLGKVLEATALLLEGLGYDWRNDATVVDTPQRVTKYYAEFFNRDIESFTTFDKEVYDETVVCRDIQFFSLCEHHILPFRGLAHVAYKPADKVAGLSKLARVVDLFAGRLQLQERMTSQIADYLTEHLKPAGVAVVIEAEHLCMAMRGIRRAHHNTWTTAVRGCFADDPIDRAEILAQLRPR